MNKTVFSLIFSKYCTSISIGRTDNQKYHSVPIDLIYACKITFIVHIHCKVVSDIIDVEHNVCTLYVPYSSWFYIVYMYVHVCITLCWYRLLDDDSPFSLPFSLPQTKAYNDPGMGRIIYERSGVSTVTIIMYVYHTVVPQLISNLLCCWRIQPPLNLEKPWKSQPKLQGHVNFR